MTMPNTESTAPTASQEGYRCVDCLAWVPTGQTHSHFRGPGPTPGFPVAPDGVTAEQAERVIKQLTRIADAIERANALSTGAPRW